MSKPAESTGPLKDPNPETLMLAFAESREITAKADDWIEAIDQKIVTLFTLSSGTAALVPALADNSSGTLLRLGGCAWLIVAVMCLCAFWPRKMSVSPDPDGIYRPKWLAIGIDEYRLKRLGSMGTIYLENRELVARKARLLRYAMVAVGAEIGLFVSALAF